MKIFQIVENLHKGAVENWLVRTFIEINRIKPDWEWTFFCVYNDHGNLDEIVLENGGKIIKSEVSISNKFTFLSNLRKTIREGDYNVIHAHHDYLNAYYLFAFWGLGAFKISQIHNTDKHLPIKSRLGNLLLIPFFKLINNIGYDFLVGISSETIKEFKIKRKGDCNKDILYYGIDIRKYQDKSTSRAEIFSDNQLPDDSILLLFIGRFTVLKNPSFVLDILNEFRTRGDERFYAFFIGEGDGLLTINEKLAKFNLFDKVRIIGWVDNPEKYLQVADFFIFPRMLKPTEGFGMVMLEAQAAGIDTIVSKGVLEETIVCDDLVHVMDNVTNPSEWADKILEVHSRTAPINSEEKLITSRFNIVNSIHSLINLYEFQ